MSEFGKREGDVVLGTVERIEPAWCRQHGRAVASCRSKSRSAAAFQQGERVRAYLYRVGESPPAYSSSSPPHPQFLAKLFEIEAPGDR